MQKIFIQTSKNNLKVKSINIFIFTSPSTTTAPDSIGCCPYPRALASCYACTFSPFTLPFSLSPANHFPKFLSLHYINVTLIFWSLCKLCPHFELLKIFFLNEDILFLRGIYGQVFKYIYTHTHLTVGVPQTQKQF